jgi:hypothetical protein
LKKECFEELTFETIGAFAQFLRQKRLFQQPASSPVQSAGLPVLAKGL